MSPGLVQGDMVLTFHTSNIRHNDVIAFYYGNDILIKRVIATGGETVNIDSNGIVSVNGRTLNEPYVLAPSIGNYNIKFPYLVPAGDWFVMGDDRALSEDSRLKIIGPVTRTQIIGRVVWKLWPLSRFGVVN